MCMAKLSLPMVGRRVAVEWMLPNGRHASLAGLVVEHRMELNDKKEESHKSTR